MLARMCYAMQNPLDCAFVVVLPSAEDDAEHHDFQYDGLGVNVFARTFRISWGNFLYISEGDIDAAWPVQFLPHTTLKRGGKVETDSEWLSLDELKEIIPFVELHAIEEEPVATPKENDVWCDRAWVLDFLEELGGHCCRLFVRRRL